MKKTAFFCLTLCLALLLCCVSAAASAVPDSTGESAPQVPGSDLSVTNGCNTMDAAVPLDGTQKKLDTAQAAILYEMNSDTLLYAWNPDARVYPASLVKLMTALVALEEGNLTGQVTVTSQMLSAMAKDDIKASLKEGEVLTLQDLVYWMLVSSSNEASVVIACHIAGSCEAFVGIMNRRAGEMGCSDTHYTNVHGFHDTEQYTTARDMGRFLLEALKNETFSDAFSAPNYTIPATNMSEERNLKTTNYFISSEVVKKFYDARVTGGKSGAVSIKDRSLVCTAESGDVRLLGIVMGAVGETEEDGYSMKRYGNFEEMETLLHYGFDSFKFAQILHSSRSLEQFQVEGGANDVVGQPVKDAYSALPQQTGTEELSWRYNLEENLTAPVTAGQRIGTVQVWYGGVCIAQSEMAAMNSSRVKTESQQPVTESREDSEGSMLGFLIVLGILMAVMAVLFGLFYAYNLIRRAIIRSRRKKRRRNRRRSR